MCVCVYVRTCTVCFCARPGESVLTHSSSTALQLVAAGAFEIARGPVVVPITVTLHVAVVWGEQRAAAANYTERGAHDRRTWDFG